MEYTVKINDSTPIASSLIKMLKELAKEHKFLEISATDEIHNNIVEELDSRYNAVINNMEEGDSWEIVKKRLMSK